MCDTHTYRTTLTHSHPDISHKGKISFIYHHSYTSVAFYVCVRSLYVRNITLVLATETGIREGPRWKRKTERLREGEAYKKHSLTHTHTQPIHLVWFRLFFSSRYFRISRMFWTWCIFVIFVWFRQIDQYTAHVGIIINLDMFMGWFCHFIFSNEYSNLCYLLWFVWRMWVI